MLILFPKNNSKIFRSALTYQIGTGYFSVQWENKVKQALRIPLMRPLQHLVHHDSVPILYGTSSIPINSHAFILQSKQIIIHYVAYSSSVYTSIQCTNTMTCSKYTIEFQQKYFIMVTFFLHTKDFYFSSSTAAAACFMFKIYKMWRKYKINKLKRKTK